jgi:hypothetical protein
MTTERSQAYARVLALLDEAPQLQRTECDLLRDAADALLFAQAPDTSTLEAVAEAGGGARARQRTRRGCLCDQRKTGDGDGGRRQR